jgi:hypothetical protein
MPVCCNDVDVGKVWYVCKAKEVGKQRRNASAHMLTSVALV